MRGLGFQRIRSRLLVFVHDLAMIPLAWGLTYWVRFNLAYIPPEFLDAAAAMLPLVMLVMGTSFWAFGLYRSVWRFASLTDLVRIGQAVATGTTLLLLLLFVFNRMAFVPRSLPLLFVIFQVLLLAGPRLFYRWLKDRRLDFGQGQRVLIVGAGRAGPGRCWCGICCGIARPAMSPSPSPMTSRTARGPWSMGRANPFSP